MADIGEFAQRVAEKFQASQLGVGARFNLGLPTAVVEEFVKTVFYASLVVDEGRYPTVSLMSYQGGKRRDFHFRFDPPREPSPVEIAKLSHATASGGHLCCVSDNGKLLIEGIQVTMLDELRQFGYSSFRVGNPLKLLIKGPGHIEVSTGGIALTYKAGEVAEEVLLQHSNVMGELAATVAQELAQLTRGHVESIDDIFNDLAEGIVKQGHGGMLLVAKNVDLGQFSSCRQVNCSLLRQTLVRYWNDVATLLAESGGIGNVLGGGNQQDASPHSLTLASDTTMLENCVGSIAHLAGMDGAIVMDNACNVVAFNAIISKSADNKVAARLVDQIGRELSLADVGRNRGSRHQSALSYVMRVPDSFAFVISQDGSVSALHNRGDGTVLYERGLDVLY
jgi:hypothetical protein